VTETSLITTILKMGAGYVVAAVLLYLLVAKSREYAKMVADVVDLVRQQTKSDEQHRATIGEATRVLNSVDTRLESLQGDVKEQKAVLLEMRRDLASDLTGPIRLERGQDGR
jgi:ABC-type transporter Mla subunit MlaD